jgi:ABC-type transport system involved in cytochrome c biogenesis permease component
VSRALLALVGRDLKLAARVGGSGTLGLVFFLLIVTLVPFALGPDLNLLARIGPAILWLAAVLATCSASTVCSRPTRRTARWTCSAPRPSLSNS